MLLFPPSFMISSFAPPSVCYPSLPLLLPLSSSLLFPSFFPSFQFQLFPFLLLFLYRTSYHCVLSTSPLFLRYFLLLLLLSSTSSPLSIVFLLSVYVCLCVAPLVICSQVF